MRREEITVLIDKGCSFEGRLAFEGTARIAGECKGEIFSPDILVVEEGANVDAKIQASEVMIFGRVKGRIEASEQVWLAEDAVFHGDVVTPCLHISQGADFQGRSLKPNSDLKMEESSPAIETL